MAYEKANNKVQLTLTSSVRYDIIQMSSENDINLLLDMLSTLSLSKFGFGHLFMTRLLCVTLTFWPVRCPCVSVQSPGGDCKFILTVLRTLQP
jgi:flagellar biosynthesis protein FliR